MHYKLHVFRYLSVGTGQSPNDGSRCSSSMGYLEPRPHAGTEEDPKVVQRKLLETVQTLTADSGDGNSISGSRGDSSQRVGGQSGTASPEPPSQSLSAPSSSGVSRSHSSHSLKTEAGSGFRGRSLGSFFKR